MTLLEYLPSCYGGPEIRAIQGALDVQAEKLLAARDGLMEQLNVETATWGLSTWEKALGLRTDVSKDLEYRRSRIKSKLRGQGTTTVAMIQNVAESFSNGQVDVLEHPAEYRFDIKFTGTIGIPPNMEDLTAAIEEIKPAHLAYDYIIIFRTWEMVAGMTWNEAAAYTWDQLREGALA